MAAIADEEHLDKPRNTQSDKPLEEIIPAKDIEPVKTNPETENMEVHHHPDLHHKPKKWKEYFLEFLMIFLAVTLGFFAESYREHLNERSKEKEYMYSMVEDLKKDTSNFNRAIEINKTFITGIDSLITITSKPSTNNDTALLELKYFLGYCVSLYPVHFSDGTISQLKNNDGLRLLQKENIAEDIVSYYNQAKERVESQYSDLKQTSINMSQNQANHIFNYLADADEVIDPSFGHQYSDTSYISALITNDRSAIITLINNTIVYRGIMTGYIHNIVSQKQSAIYLLALIKKEYHLE